MASYRTYNIAMPTNWEDYMPKYTTRSYKKPTDVYSDYFSPYRDEISDIHVNLDALDKSKPGAYNSAYEKRINELISGLSNRKFSYDLGKDALWQQYKDNYMAQGKQAMQDTMGQAAALTGGYGNSYAAAAGNQAYQAWLGQLNNKIPELYQLALQRYNTEGADMQNLYSVLANQDAAEYGRHRDAVNDYLNDREFYNAQLQNLRAMGQNLWGQEWNNYMNTQQMNDANRQNAINAALNLYGTAWDNYKWGEQQTAANRAQAVAEDQWNANYELQRAAQAAAQSAARAAVSGGSGSGGSNSSSGNAEGRQKALDRIMSYREFNSTGGGSDYGVRNQYPSYRDYVISALTDKSGKLKYGLSDNDVEWVIKQLVG